jgi:hypothetical protein
MVAPTFANRARPNFSDILITPAEPVDKLSNDQMLKANIKIKAKGARWQPAIQLFNQEVDEFDNEMYKEFLSFMASRYKEEVKDAIETQRFKQRWDDLSEQYKEWKKKAGLDPRIWIRTGQLLDAIRVRFFPSTNSYGVGVDSTAHFRKVVTVKNDQGHITGHTLGERSETSVLFIARLMEFGTVSMPARPLFRPVQRIMQRNARDHFEDFLDLNDIDYASEE